MLDAVQHQAGLIRRLSYDTNRESNAGPRLLSTTCCSRTCLISRVPVSVCRMRGLSPSKIRIRKRRREWQMSSSEGLPYRTQVIVSSWRNAMLSAVYDIITTSSLVQHMLASHITPLHEPAVPYAA